MNPYLVIVSRVVCKSLEIPTPLLLLEARAELTHAVTTSATTIASSTTAAVATAAAVATTAATRVSAATTAVATTVLSQHELQ